MNNPPPPDNLDKIAVRARRWQEKYGRACPAREPAAAEPAFAVIDTSGLIDPMSVRRHASTCFVYAGMRRLEDQGPFRVVPVKIVVPGREMQNV